MYFPNQKTYTLGYDARSSSESLSRAFVRGFADSGADVLNIGFCASDACAYAAEKLQCDGMVMVTASHNPKEYNGFKMRKKGLEPVNFKDTGADLLKIMEAGHYRDGKGKETVVDIKDGWIGFLL